MKIYGKEITDECQYCGDVLQCELFLQGHGIKQERSNITEMFACQMGYNGEKAMQFKEAYIRQFNEMEKALLGKIKEREKGIAVRQALTKAIQQSGENDRMHGHAYSTYTDLIYKAVLGKTAKQLREELGIGKQDNLRDLLSTEELAKVKSVEMVVSGLVDCGWGYNEIKEFITNTERKLIVAA